MRVSKLLVMALATGSPLASAKSFQSSSQSPSRVPGAYILELDDAEDTSRIYSDVNDQGKIRMELKYKLFKGVSVQMNNVDTAEEAVMRMASSSAVKNVWPVTVYSVPEPKIEWIGAPDVETADLRKRQSSGNGTSGFPPHVMTQIDKLHKKGVTGKGIKIAVIDTGIDYTHPALGDGCFGDGCIVAFGTDLVGDDYNGFNEIVPDDDPMDCQGHGTHVAGIVAARENTYGFIGTAPEATLGAYRVFGCAGEAANDVLIAAYNQAFEDGADIITASIGGPSGWSEEPWAVAVTRIVEQGVPCPVSAGNEGDQGQFFASTASNGKEVLSVASFDSTISPLLLIVSDFSVDGEKAEEFGYTPGLPGSWDGIELPLWTPNEDPQEPAGGCDPFPDDTPDLSDYIVLIRRGSCTFVEKAENAAAAGARYIMFWNNVPAGTVGVDVSEVDDIIATGMVTADQGLEWLELLNDGSEVVLTVTDPDSDDAEKTLTWVPNRQTGGALSQYTTWGPTFEGDNKPQLGAPGGSILSTYPVAKGGYAVLSGTSMACPLVAGSLGLMAEVRGTFDPAELEKLLSAYSNAQLFNDGQTFYDFLAPVQQQGGGLVQVYDAAYATVILSPSSLAFNDSEHAVESLEFTIRNTGDDEMSFEVSNVPTASFYTLEEGEPWPMLQPVEPAEEGASLKFSKTHISVGAGEEVTISVTPSPPSGLDNSRLPVWSGYVVVNGSDGTSLSLPYQGIAGSLHDATVLVGSEDVYIFDSTERETLTPIPGNTTFIIPPAGTDIDADEDVLPAAGLVLAMGSPFIRIYAEPLTTSPPNGTNKDGAHKGLGEIEGSPFRWNPRSVNKFPWNGMLANGSAAPEGAYRFAIEALHIFGDPEDEDDLWDKGTSPAFRIKYEE